MVNSLIVIFKNTISYREIPLFRGAIINSMGEGCSNLFHNHINEGYNYRYPMIQYKRIRGKAAIVCIGNGVNDIGAFFSASNFQLHIGENRDELFEIESVRPHRTIVQVWDDEFHYYLRDWYPLNPENYQKYQSTESLIERTQLLERILVGNILSTCKGLNIRVEREVSGKIISLETPRKDYYKGLPMMSFSCEFKSNITLPDYIGLGKGASMGHGIIVRKKKKTTDN